MARYTSRRNSSIVADLELEGWSQPQEWKGRDNAPEAWPDTAVNALIHLFTQGPASEDQDEGRGIPNTLGWHIATLIEMWCGDETRELNCRFQAPGATLTLLDTILSTLRRSGLSDEELRNMATVEAEKLHDLYRHRLTRLVQQWYGDGIALHQAWARERDAQRGARSSGR